MNTPHKYDTIGIGYNNTRKADPYLFNRLFHLLSPTPDKHYLDVGCGTGNYTLEFAKKGIRFTGIDPSIAMLDAARQRSDQIEWISGVAEQLPFDENSFDGATATLTTHHWKDRKKGFEEIARVLKPGSKLVIFTSSPEQMEKYWLHHYFPSLMERSGKQMPSIESVENELHAAGFSNIILEKYFVHDDLQDLFLQCGKNKPEMYFDETIRNGISTFAALANKSEVEEGLRKLRNDIHNNRFQAVKEKYDSEVGDYMFVVVRAGATRPD